MIFVVMHKPATYPLNSFYIPIHVGNNNFYYNNMAKDSSGINIHLKNANYSELTAMFWIWKNSNDPVKGLVHYRRYFVTSPTILIKNWQNKLLSRSYIDKALIRFEVIVPFSSYSNNTLYDEYNDAHKISDLDLVREIIRENYPSYLSSFDHVIFSNKNSHRFFANMLISKDIFFDRYCEWLFDILFELENRINLSNYDEYQSRVFGFISERIFNVYLHHNKTRVKQLFVVNIEENQEKSIRFFLYWLFSWTGLYSFLKPIYDYLRRLS